MSAPFGSDDTAPHADAPEPEDKDRGWIGDLVDKVEDVADKIEDKVSDVESRVSDKLSDVGDAIEDKLDDLLPDLEDICGDALAPLINAKDTVMGLFDPLDGAADGASKMRGLEGDGGPSMEKASMLDGSTSGLSGKISEIASDPKMIIPAAAMCFLECWADKIKEALARFGQECEKLWEFIKTIPGKVAELLQAVWDKVKEVCESILEQIAKLKELPGEALDLITGVFDKPRKALDKMKALPDGLDAFMARVKEVVASMAVEGVDDVKLAVKKVKEPLAKASSELGAFVKAAPGKIADAFRPPFPVNLCCCRAEGDHERDIQGKIDAVGQHSYFSEIMEWLDKLLEKISEMFDVAKVKDMLVEVVDKAEGFFTPVRDGARSCVELVEGKIEEIKSAL
eukprot:TRINITY_DN9459_c0_g1_i1.p2 TRINITY_DN9459_c0_g1~~TRINITY_DN9459_c0_g1_i1.p2  ORF type:complete len:420 (+),score=186.35 TRINITY_DN9459_c0_g1_i1:68-1261(+)